MVELFSGAYNAVKTALTKGLIRSRKSRDRKYNGHEKAPKKTKHWSTKIKI
jgi:hypothetical protein